MRTGAISRALAVGETTFVGTFTGTSWIGLALAALAYPALVAVLVGLRVPDVDVLAAAESLYSALFLPVILLLLCLVNGVNLFRSELDEDTLLYPMQRTVPRSAIVAGKYLGFAGATLLVLLPSAVLGTALAAAYGAGPTYATAGLLEALVVVTTLGTLAYGALFLVMGLVTRQALVIGLLYGFIWETFVSQIPGPIRELTVVYYLRGIGSRLAIAGPLGGGPSDVGVAGGSIGLLLTAVMALVVAAFVLRYAELRPG